MGLCCWDSRFWWVARLGEVCGDLLGVLALASYCRLMPKIRRFAVVSVVLLSVVGGMLAGSPPRSAAADPPEGSVSGWPTGDPVDDPGIRDRLYEIHAAAD